MRNGSFRKWISVILSIVILFSGAVAVFADDEPHETQPAENQPAEGEPAEGETELAVARLYLCSRKKKTFGHIFVYIENLSEETLMVGAYELPPNEGVSIGTFGFTCADGFGIYYNIEAYIINAYGDESIICLSDELTREEMETFSHRLLYSNTWDFMFFNCVSFALMMWNSVASPFLMPFLFPFFTRLQIKRHGGTEAPTLFFPEKERVYKLRGSGDNCYLEPVSEKSIRE